MHRNANILILRKRFSRHRQEQRRAFKNARWLFLRGLRFLLASNLLLAFIDLDLVELASLIPNQFVEVVRKRKNDDLYYKRVS